MQRALSVEWKEPVAVLLILPASPCPSPSGITLFLSPFLTGQEDAQQVRTLAVSVPSVIATEAQC